MYFIFPLFTKFPPDVKSNSLIASLIASRGKQARSVARSIYLWLSIYESIRIILPAIYFYLVKGNYDQFTIQSGISQPPYYGWMALKKRLQRLLVEVAILLRLQSQVFTT